MCFLSRRSLAFPLHLLAALGFCGHDFCPLRSVSGGEQSLALVQEMYKNQLQELAQRSCFNLPSYSCMREGPDHAPRFKATVNFNGEVFESPNYCSTLRQAEHSAAEVALNILSKRGPSQSLAARLLDETGVYKNLLQEISQRAGAALPVYTTVRSGLGHLPVFTCTVELAGINFTGEPAKNKKQAEKNAAMAAWSSLKQLPHQSGFSSQTSSEGECNEEQEQITIARALANHRFKEIALAQQLRQQQSAAMRKMLAQREGVGLSVEHQHYESLRGRQSVSSDTAPEGCSRSSQNQQQLHLPAPPVSGSKILPFLRSMFHQRSRPGSLHDSPSSPSLKREVIAGARGTAACCVGNSKPLTLAGEAIVAQRAPANARSGQRTTSQQMTSPFEEHERDEGEWLRGDLSRENNTNTNALSNSNLTDWTTAFGSPNCTPWSNSSQSWGLQQQQQQRRQRMMQAMPRHAPPYVGGSRCHASPSSMAAPVRIRTSIPVCSAPPTRSEFRNSDTNLIPPAPAVQVRSVTPVCSAPPARRPTEQDPDTNSVGEADGPDSTLQLLNQLRL